jgi:hypothetical protein
MNFRYIHSGAFVILCFAGISIAGDFYDFEKIKVVQNLIDAPLRLGEPLIQARTRIIKSGWRPLQMHQHDDYEYSGAENALRSLGIAEVDSCSVDAGVRCILYYEKNQECLRIDTVGERVGDMTVVRWITECPGS